jgi:hypothetical protein
VHPSDRGIFGQTEDTESLLEIAHEEAQTKTPVVAERLKTPNSTITRKRKAIDISEGIDLEVVWQRKPVLDQPLPSNGPDPVQSETEVHLLTLSFIETPEQVHTTIRVIWETLWLWADVNRMIIPAVSFKTARSVPITIVSPTI